MDMDPSLVEISGDGLTVDSVASVARQQTRVELSSNPVVRNKLSSSRRLLENKLAAGEIIYGVNTGFGGNVRFLIPDDDLSSLQENLFRSLSCGVGLPLPAETVRAAMLLRANALAKGLSGVRPQIIERLLDLLNHRITPVVPRYGSVGASGDLIPSAYIARALLGEGEVFYQGKNLPASDALQHANLSRSELTAKEGLALVNGTTVMTGIAALVIYDGGYLARLVLACASFAVEALNATDDPFSVYLRLLSVPDIEEVFRPVRYCFTAAAPMAIPIARQWRERLRRPIYEGYGLTETSPFASYNHDVYYRDGSVETPIETVEMKIVDPEGLELPVGEQGEIAIKGPNVMLGYFRRPNETAEVLRGGWFLTGDIGKRDDDGYFYIVDRAKDMINVSGFKVWPREVEEILLQHPSISEVGVIGIADPVSVEAVKAFAVLKQRDSISEQDLIEYARNRMAVYKAPRFIEFIDALPRNPAGKVLKRELRARATNDAAPSVRVA